ncbi:MAG: 7-carboxy-7-deazaguanine synthase QueE [Magnetococcus sp. YQC-9]
MNDRADSPRYPICEMFASIQGEGSHTGRPTLFVRAWGCPLSCIWCDEPLHRDPVARRLFSIDEILAELERLAPGLKHVVLTGGEPLALPDLSTLVRRLKEADFRVAMESSGLGGPLPNPMVDWLTLSPKTLLPDTLLAQANEIKFILGPSGAGAEAILELANRFPNIWVQPRANGLKPDFQAIARCYQLVLASQGRLRLSLQTHKFIGVR